MESEERNKKLDEFMSIYGLTSYSEAIRECDKKARAWDALEEHVFDFTEKYTRIGEDPAIIGYEAVRGTMSRLLKTQPKDPLEVLEDTMMNLPPWGTTRVEADRITPIKILLDREDVLAAIRRLRGKK